MKSLKLFLSSFGILILVFFITTVTGCKKNDSSTNPANTNNTEGTESGTNTDQSRNENWLIGTWEGTTSVSLETPFNNKKVRIVLSEVRLIQEDHPAENQTYRVYAYSGIFTWDTDGSNWSMAFKGQNFPLPGQNTIIWGCNSMFPSAQFVENISLRLGDTANVNPNYSVNLDMSTYGTTNSSITALDFIGTIEIESEGNYTKTEFPTNNMLHLTKE